MKKFRKRLNLKGYVLLYFLVFLLCMLGLLWLFEYFMLPKIYRSSKIHETVSAGDSLISAFKDDDIQARAMKIAFDNSMFILVTDNRGNDIVFENNMGSYSFFGADKRDNFGRTLYQFRKQLDESDDHTITKILQSDEFKRDEIFHCRKFSVNGQDLYLYMESPIEPIESTIKIMNRQLIYITIMLFEIAFIISVLISNRLSTPIEDLTVSAKKFGEGDFDVEFKTEGYREIEELGAVLDEARNEVAKVTDLKKDLIANVSHDLRTPLTMVKAYAEMIRDLSGNDPVKREKHCEIIIDEADRLTALVNSILELSKLESQAEELNITQYSIHEQINDVLKRYTLLTEQKNCEIKFISDEDVQVKADYDKLSQVLYNFINNAINYSPEEKHIKVRQINSTDCVRIEVTDNGVGIPKEKLSEVFDRYYRGGKVKRETVGTGLGLSICKEILKRHGFAFGVLSEEGKGSTFWFEIPTET